MSFLLLTFALAATTPAKAPPPKPKAKPAASAKAVPSKQTVIKSQAVASPAPVPPVSTLSFEERLLAAHNAERLRTWQRPLKWSARLATDARKWAEIQARTSSFEHAPAEAGGEDQGENLWMGTAKSYTPEQMVGAWVDERRYYVRGPFPKNSRTGDWLDVGHYTQLIWYNTSEVGCALAANLADEYLVCRYMPPGNWEGEDALGGSSSPRR